MKETVEKIVRELVNDAETVVVNEETDGKSTVIFVKVGEGEMGRIIGREGRTVKAIRSLLYYAGQKQGKRFQLDLID